MLEVVMGEGLSVESAVGIAQLFVEFGLFGVAAVSIVLGVMFLKIMERRVFGISFAAFGLAVAIAAVFAKPDSQIYLFSLQFNETPDAGVSLDTATVRDRDRRGVWSKYPPARQGKAPHRDYTIDFMLASDKELSDCQLTKIYIEYEDPNGTGEKILAPLQIPYDAAQGNRQPVTLALVKRRGFAGGGEDDGNNSFLKVNSAGSCTENASVGAPAVNLGPVTGMGWLSPISQAQAAPAAGFAARILTEMGLRPVRNAGGFEPVVVYYYRSADGDALGDALKQKGIAFRSVRSKLTVSSNAIWIGEDVPEDLARATADSLVKAGMRLRYLGPFVPRGFKSNRIEIGYSSTFSGRDLLTSEQVANLNLRQPPMQIYFHIVDAADREESDGLQKQIADVDFGGSTAVIFGSDLVKARLSENQIRYFSEKDADASIKLAQELETRSDRKFTTQFMGKKYRSVSGVLEVWLD
jgi:hypothetical protein